MIRLLARDGAAGVDGAFAELPHAVYARDPRWIPEDPAALAAAFGPDNPWFARGRAVTFAVPGRARLAAFRAPGCRVGGREAAFFGYWEHRGAPDASLALFDEAAAWARAAGAELLVGPVNFSTLGTYRLRISAEPDAWSFPGEPHTPPGYALVLARAGFAALQSYVTQLGAPDATAGPAAADALAARAAARRALLDAGYIVAPVDAAGWLALLPELYRAADATFGANLGYEPPSWEEFVAGFGAPAARRLCPHTTCVARAPDGTLAGFLLVQPHWGPLVARGAPGGPVPLATLAYEEHAPRLAALGGRTAVAKTLGVLPAHRRAGVGHALALTAVERGRPHYDRWLAALVRDDNPSRRLGAPHARAERRYALYARPLAGGGGG